MPNTLTKRNQSLMIFVIWLVHVSGIIGISLGFEDWFLPKTPLNLLLMFGFVMYSFNVNNAFKWLTVFLVFIVGFGVELLGVHTGIPFGEYAYGHNLGPQIAEVPLMIGVNWVMLIFITGCISNQLNKPIWLKALIGASLMVFLDVFIEEVAPVFDFWYWTNHHAPLINYIAWFVISFGLHYWFQARKTTGNIAISIHLFLAQLVFFAVFYLNYAL